MKTSHPKQSLRPAWPTAARRSSTEAGGEGSLRDRWLVSYADLVTLLFALFVVLYAAADHDRARAIADVMAEQTSKAAMPGGRGVLPGGVGVMAARAAVERALASNKTLSARVRVAGVPGGFVVSLAEAGFFAPGDATVREDAGALLDTLADTLRAPSHRSARLRVEGHTDSTPIATARYPSNWELSSARAAAVLSHLTSRGIPSSRLSLAGYAGERPVADNSTNEGRALNRRVDLVVLDAKE
jgi:chemotaxis protein MotB